MALFLVYFFVSKNNINFFNSSNNNYSSENIDEKAIDIGSKGYISSAEIIQTKTGTGPWDENDEPGNDSSEDNDIVRSFDQVVWTVDLTMSLKDNSQGASLSGGRIEVEAELPENCADVMKWDLESMLWMENGKVSDDGRSITGSYTMTDTEVTVPGKQTLVFVLKVEGAGNKTEIVPTFRFKLTGNEDTEKREVTSEKVIVSATPRYNILIQKNSQLNYRSYFDLTTGKEASTMGENTVNGRIQGYGIMLQLYNNTANKELRGIELPEGDISFDIVLTESEKTSSDPLTESEFIPVLWDYKENMSGNTGNLNRNLLWRVSESSYAATPLSTYNKSSSRLSKYCYDGGNWTIEQIDSNTYHVTIKDYHFDTEQWHFPRTGLWTLVSNNIPTNVGQFSVGYIQVILQFPEKVENVTSLYLKVEAKNLNVKSITGTAEHNEQNTSDNMINTQITLYPAGSIGKYNTFQDKSGKYLWSVTGAGDAYASIGQEIKVTGGIQVKTGTDETMRSYNILQKFDDEAFEPLADSNINSGSGSSSKVTVLYATKPDGTGWESQEEMSEAKEEDLVYFASMKEIIERKYTCVGVLFEGRDVNYVASHLIWDNIPVNIKKDPSIVGKTFATVNNVKAWTDNISFSYLNQRYEYDEETGITTMELTEEYPDPWRSVITDKYTKTEYDENSQIINGTNYIAYSGGNSILITGATQLVDVESIIKGTSELKTNFDLGRNENVATFKVSPDIHFDSGDKADIDGVTVLIETNLPKGLTYISGSSNRNEPEIVKNEDGSMKISWKIYGYSVGDYIEPIIFDAQIDNETVNGTQYIVETVISEFVQEGEQYKIGNSRPDVRTAKTSINIINLASHRLYKEVETPIIEKNGDIVYSLIYENKTDDPVNDFQLLDILPYNGDTRGTSYNGTYTLENIEVVQTTSGEEQAVDNLSLYTTTSETVRTIDATDDGIGTDSIWKEKTIGNNINESATGFAITGEVAGRTRIELEVTLSTDNNQARDKYVNNAMAQVYADSEQMITGNVTTQVVYREINGRVWEDLNKNGTIDEDEPVMSGITVTLINTETQEEKTMQTELNGEYAFEDLAKGNYKVKVSGYGEEYILTEKGVGTNQEINSKFNEDSQETDEITRLNSIASPEIIEEYVNAGIKKKEFKVTTEVEGEGGSISGQDENPYEVVEYAEDSTKDIIATPEYGYKVSSIEVNGEQIEFTEKEDHTVELSKFIHMLEDKHVVVRFERIEGEVIVHHYIEGTENKVPSTEEGQVVEDETIRGYVGEGYTTEVAENVDKAYEYVSVSGNTTGEIVEDRTEVIYYYKLKEAIIDSEITKTTETEEIATAEQEVPYEIVYNASITAYRGDATVTIVDFLPYEIDEEASSLDDGEYDPLTKTISWTETIENIDTYTEGTRNISITKNITVVYTGVDASQDSLTNKVEGTINLEETEQTDVVEETEETPITIPGMVIVKYLEEGTERVIAEQEEITGRVGTEYETEQKEIVGYDFVRVVGNTTGTIPQKTIEVIYYYRIQDVNITENTITKDGTISIDERTDKVSYNLVYEGVIDTYRGEVVVYLEDTLPYKIDVDESNLDGGTYDEDTNTIKWYENIGEVDTLKTGENIPEQIRVEKNIEVLYKDIDVYQDNMVNEIKGVLYLPAQNEQVEAEDDHTTDIEVDGDLIVKYVDKYTNEEIETRVTKSGRVGTEFDVSGDKKEIDGYTLIEEPAVKTGTYTEEVQEKIYYYAKNTSVHVTYVDKATNEEIAEDELIKGYEKQKYNTEKKVIEGYTYVEDTGNTTGEMTRDRIEVVYYYLYNTRVIVEHIDEYTNELLATETEEGLVGDIYESSAKDFEGYVLVREPEEKTVTMTREEIVLRYYYSYVSGGVIEKHIDDITGEVLDEKVYEGTEGDPYETHEKEFPIYDLVEEKYPANSKGTMTRDVIEVKYYYIKKASVRVEYIDEITGEKLTEDVLIQGHENDPYTTEEKEFEGYDLVKIPSNARGEMTITVNEDGTYDTEILVQYYYKYVSTGVIERHYDDVTGELLAEESYTGYEGDSYKTTSKEFAGYDLVEEKYPENSEGTMTKELIEVNYYYIKKATVRVEYVDKLSGEKLTEDVIIDGHENDPYTTEQKEFEGYEFVEVVGNPEGVMNPDEEIIITYYYLKPAKVIVRYLEEETEKELSEETVIEGHEGDEYVTGAKEIEYYKISKLPDNAAGEMKDTIYVTYYYKRKTVDFSIDKKIGRIEIDGKKQRITNEELGKAEVYRKSINSTEIRVEYEIEVRNEGEIAGKVTILEKIPEYLSMKKADNPGWEITGNEARYETEEIGVGESKTYKVVMEWKKGDGHFGMQTNIAKIETVETPSGFEEENLQNNADEAEVMITISTGVEKVSGIVLIALIYIAAVIYMNRRFTIRKDDKE